MQAPAGCNQPGVGMAACYAFEEEDDSIQVTAA
jgi:hypothetical protein